MMCNYGGQRTLLLSSVLALAFTCYQHVQGEEKVPFEIPLDETASLGSLPPIAPELIDAVVSGDSKIAAETLLSVTYDEPAALASVPLLLLRISECKEKMDDATLVREKGQPLWMRLYRAHGYSTKKQTRKHQILLRLADCIREASPSMERAQARKTFLDMLSRDFATDPYCITIASRSVIFASPFQGVIRSETGWEDLLNFFDKFLLLGTSDVNQIGDLRSAFAAYCRQNVEKEKLITEKYRHVLGEGFSATLERTKEANFVLPYCDESYYRTLLTLSASTWVDIYADGEHPKASGVIEGLLTGTGQARVESFPLVKPYLKSYRKGGDSYSHWVPLLRRYCLPVAENASSEEIERQQWLLDELIGQVARNERGDPKFGTDPIRLLRNMILPVTDAKEQDGPEYVRNPYGKERVLEVLLAQTVSTDTHAARSALRELEVLCKFDDSTARSIEQGLTARKESILTKEYPSDDLSATSKEDIYKAMEHTITRAQAELK